MVSKYRKTERDNHILGSLPPPPFRRPPFVPWETPPVISVRTFISQNGSCSAKLPVYCLFSYSFHLASQCLTISNP